MSKHLFSRSQYYGAEKSVEKGTYHTNVSNWAVGDPGFATVESVSLVLFIVLCSSFHTRRITSMVWFSQAKTTNEFTSSYVEGDMRLMEKILSRLPT